MDKKNFKPTEEMIQAAKNVFTCMAFVQTIEPIVRGYQRKILAAHQWHIARHWVDDNGHDDEIILDPKYAFLLEDDDFKVYLKEQNEERIKAKLHVDDPEFCPLLVAEDMLVKARWGLFNAMEPLTGLTCEQVTRSLKHIEEYTRLCLGLLAPFVGKGSEILASYK